jgi:hypothetical protein
MGVRGQELLSGDSAMASSLCAAEPSRDFGPLSQAMLERFRALLGRLHFQPARDEIRLTGDGFERLRKQRLLFRICWSEVKEILAFKVDQLTFDCICLGFRISNQGHYYQVDEEMMGYRELVEEIEQRFPDHNPRWFHQVAFPAFATNYTTVWGERLVPP